MAAVYGDLVKRIMAKASDGFRLSTLHGSELKVAERLIDQGKLHSIPLAGGDRHVEKT